MASSSKTPPAVQGHPSTETDTDTENASPWRDRQLENWLDATQPAPTVEIVLENLGARSWLRSLLATLSSQYGTQHYRFIARENNDVVGRIDHAISGTFPVSPLQLPVDQRFRASDAWGDEATERLEELEQHLRDQGWQLTGQGEHWWSKVFTRQGPGVPAS